MESSVDSLVEKCAESLLVTLGACIWRELLGGTRVALVLELLGVVSSKLVLTLLGFNFDSLSSFFLAKNNLISFGFTTVVFTFGRCLGIASGFGLVSGLARSVSSGVGFGLSSVSGLVLL